MGVFKTFRFSEHSELPLSPYRFPQYIMGVWSVPSDMIGSLTRGSKKLYLPGICQAWGGARSPITL
jgi:hypothetical protein